MGKAGRWLRHFLPGGRRDRSKDKPLAPAPELDQPLVLTAATTPASTPGAKEKRRWSFRRPAAASPGPGKEKDGGGRVAAYAFLAEPRVDPDQHAVAVAIATAAAAEAAMVAKHAAAAAVRLSASKRVAVVGIEDAAAIKIQAVFRSYLARKALCALRGLVKLQALVRGHLVRRQASHTLRCMQALVAAQNRARVARLRLLDDDKPAALRTPTRSTTPTRRSPHHPRSNRHHHHHQQQMESSAEENVKIVEVDTGGGEAQHAHALATPRTASRRSSCYATPLCRTPSKNEMYQKVSPTPSALTDASARSLSGRYDDFSFATARNSPYHYDYYASRQQHHHAGAGADHPLLAVPSYMANTQSSRAKARSQSAPRQRHSVSSSSSATAAAVAEVPWERQGSGRRRASLEGQAAAAAQRGGLQVPARRVQRCPSQASAPASACPWGARLDRWSASAHDSECGSTSTVLTAATTTYCWSMATDNAGMAKSRNKFQCPVATNPLCLSSVADFIASSSPLPTSLPLRLRILRRLDLKRAQHRTSLISTAHSSIYACPSSLELARVAYCPSSSSPRAAWPLGSPHVLPPAASSPRPRQHARARSRRRPQDLAPHELVAMVAMAQISPGPGCCLYELAPAAASTCLLPAPDTAMGCDLLHELPNRLLARRPRLLHGADLQWGWGRVQVRRGPWAARSGQVRAMGERRLAGEMAGYDGAGGAVGGGAGEEAALWMGEERISQTCGG
ncbi:hypothetical protein EJB05_50281, partial [Eragrostis curvula]